MSNPFAEGDLLRITPGYRMQWEEAQDAHVLLFPEGMIKLNPTASEILKRCDGRTATDIIADLNAQFPEADLEADVMQFLEIAHKKGWLSVK